MNDENNPPAPAPVEPPPAAPLPARPSTVLNLDRNDLTGSLIVIEGPDGSGRSTQIAMLTEWLESTGFAVQTIGLRRSRLLSKNIDKAMARNTAGRLAITLMYATDLYDQLENVMIPAMRANCVVLADRYIYTLIARASVRGIGLPYLHGIYRLALKPHLTFWLNISPEVAFEREFKKAGTISYWESGRDLYLSDDLYQSFVRYQAMMSSEFRRMARDEDFIELDAEAPIRVINSIFRKHIARHLGIKNLAYTPSSAIAQSWNL